MRAEKSKACCIDNCLHGCFCGRYLLCLPHACFLGAAPNNCPHCLSGCVKGTSYYQGRWEGGACRCIASHTSDNKEGAFWLPGALRRRCHCLSSLNQMAGATRLRQPSSSRGPVSHPRQCSRRWVRRLRFPFCLLHAEYAQHHRRLHGSPISSTESNQPPTRFRTFLCLEGGLSCQ